MALPDDLLGLVILADTNFVFNFDFRLFFIDPDEALSDTFFYISF